MFCGEQNDLVWNFYAVKIICYVGQLSLKGPMLRNGEATAAWDGNYNIFFSRE